MLKWAGPIKESDITVKELVPIIIAEAIWGGAWQGKTMVSVRQYSSGEYHQSGDLQE